MHQLGKLEPGREWVRSPIQVLCPIFYTGIGVLGK